MYSTRRLYTNCSNGVSQPRWFSMISRQAPTPARSYSVHSRYSPPMNRCARSMNGFLSAGPESGRKPPGWTVRRLLSDPGGIGAVFAWWPAWLALLLFGQQVAVVAHDRRGLLQETPQLTAPVNAFAAADFLTFRRVRIAIMDGVIDPQACQHVPQDVVLFATELDVLQVVVD